MYKRQICASEQSIITEACIHTAVEAELKARGGYFLSPEEADRLSRLILRPNGTMNPVIVGKSALDIARLAGLSVPGDVKVLIEMCIRDRS